jgi:hypothetical protein
MKDGKGESIQLTSSLQPISNATIHRPIPLSVGNPSLTPFDHILDTVLGQGNESILKRALLQDGIQDLPSLLTLDSRLVKTLSFVEVGHPTSKLTTINEEDAILIHAFHKLARMRVMLGKTMDDDWRQVTDRELEKYRMPMTNSAIISSGCNHNFTQNYGHGRSRDW